MLGFKETASVIIKGEVFERYMGVPGIEAEHVTLVAEGAAAHTEIQLLRYLHPIAEPDPDIRDLSRIGMNHICFAVDDIEAGVAAMRGAGYHTRNDRKLVFDGPEGVTIELSQIQVLRGASSHIGAQSPSFFSS